MRITAITTAVVQANFDYTFVRVDTDDDLYGIGEAFHAPGLTAMIRDLGRVLVGQDARHVEPLRRRLVAACSNAGGNAAGIAHNAISGIEAALWDLNGRRLDVPIVELLGGGFRSSVEVYADLHAGGQLESLDAVGRYRRPFWEAPDGETELGGFYWEAAEPNAVEVDALIGRATDAVADGFRRIKFDLDVFASEREAGDRTVSARDLAGIELRALALRDALGPDIEIAFDCHWRFDVPTALAVARAVAPARPMWLEDPVPPAPDAMAAVTRDSPVPIATGENTFSVEGFQRLVDNSSAHILTPDCQKTGGLLESLRIGELAGRHYIPIAPHCIASPLGFLASVHVCAALENAVCLEWHGADVTFWSELVESDEPIIAGGRTKVPHRPGVGVDLDLNVARRYAAPDEAFFAEAALR